MKSFSRKMKYSGLSLMAVSSLAMASVTFDPATGHGFVGKGDVQTPFGWNNAMMQQHHQHIVFSYTSVSTVTQACKDSPVRGEFVITGYRFKTQTVGGQVAADSRKKGQWVGWNLTGFSGEVTTEDDANWTNILGQDTPTGCPDGGTPFGEPVKTESVGGELTADDLDTGKSTVLPPTPTL